MGWKEELRHSFRVSFRDLPAELLERLGLLALVLAIASLYDVWLWRSTELLPLPWAVGVGGVAAISLIKAGKLRKGDEPLDRDPFLLLGPIGIVAALFALLGIWIWGWDVAESLWVAGTAGPLGGLLLLRWRRKERALKQTRPGHVAAVYYVTLPDEEPYYVAICDCDWLGNFHPAQEPAFEDARKHAPEVEDEVQFRT